MKRRFAALLLPLFAALTLMVIPAAAMPELEPPSHEHNVKSWTVVEDGHSGVCADCGETVTQTHSVGEGAVTQVPTCQAAGKKIFTCFCGHSYEETVPKLDDHVCDQWTSGETQHTGTCIHCGQTVTRDHAYGEGTVTLEPTCQATGTKRFTCVCGHAYEETLPVLADHVYGDYTKDDTQHSAQCVFCGQSTTGEHSWNEGVITVPPTCQAEGAKLFTCQQCGHTKQERVPITDHVYGAWVNLDENYHQHSCTCGNTAKEKHTWDKGVITRQPTCDKYGIKTYTCTGCGTKKDVETYRTSHKYSNSCDITCNRCGFIRRPEHQFSTTWSHDDTNHWHNCTVCKIEDLVEPHTASDWIVDVPAGEYTDGERHQECTVCGYVMTKEVIPATGCLHGNEELRGVKEPTCIFEGYTGDWVCPRCEAVVIPGEVIPSLPHNTTVKNQKDPTCTQEGYTGDTVCQDCLAWIDKGETIPLLPHNTAIENRVEPTCIKEGYSGDQICQDCRVTVSTGEAIPVVSHEMELRNVRDPGCISDGYTGDLMCKHCLRILEPGHYTPSIGHQYVDGYCVACRATDPDYQFPSDTSRPSGLGGDFAPPPLSPVIIAAIVMLAVTGAGIVVLIILIAKKK